MSGTQRLVAQFDGRPGTPSASSACANFVLTPPPPPSVAFVSHGVSDEYAFGAVRFRCVPPVAGDVRVVGRVVDASWPLVPQS